MKADDRIIKILETHGFQVVQQADAKTNQLPRWAIVELDVKNEVASKRWMPINWREITDWTFEDTLEFLGYLPEQPEQVADQ